jgi:hypothetical protein
MASLSPPATTEQMIQEELKQRDRMMTQSIQALAMDRLRSSVRSLSRETGFQSRPAVEQFSQAPLYIPNPEYMKWSNTLGKLVGTPAPTRMTLEQAVEAGIAVKGRVRGYVGRGPMKVPTYEYKFGTYTTYGDAKSERIRRALNQVYRNQYRAWEEAQRMLPP